MTDGQKASGHGEAMAAAARRFSRELAEGAAERDLHRTMPLAEARRLRELGFHAARVPTAYGGPGVSFVELAEVMMHLGAGDPNLAQMIQPHFVLLDWLLLEAPEAQRRRFFADVLKGDIITNAFSERGTKTPGHFATTLSRSGGRYRLSGSKFYATGSLIADKFYVMATLEDGTLALAIVPKDRAGLEIVDDWDGMGQRTTASGTVRLNDVAVEAAEVVPVGWGKQRSYLGAASQLVHASIDVGIAHAALSDAILYAKTKARPVAESGVDRATDDPYVLQLVGQMSVIAHSAEALLYRSAAKVDRTFAAHHGGSVGRDGMERLYSETSIAVAEAKAAANDASLRVSEMLFGVGGASATLRKYDLDRHWRNARTHTTHDPVSYKYKAIGDYLLNDRPPPISTKI